MINKGLLRKLTSFSFARFLVSGGVNTLLTYGGYLLLLNAFSYKVAYTISYVAGIALAFGLNRYFVFKNHRGARSAILFPFIYLIQYLCSMLVLWVWIEKLRLYTQLAPLVSIAITLPLTYALSKVLFSPPSKRTDNA